MDYIVLLGIVLSIIFFEITDISPGGIIVPGYLVLFLNRPERIIATIVISLIILLTVNKLAEYTILYGRRKFTLMILVGFIVRLIIGKAFVSLDIPVMTTMVIGYLIPGIIANEMDRQGITKTLASLFVVVFMVRLIMILTGSVQIL